MGVTLPPVYISQIPDDPNAVSLGGTEPEDNAVSLPTPGATQQPLPPDVAQQRATKTVRGLGELMTRDPEALYEDFLTGQEDMVRRQAATAVDHEMYMQRQQSIQDLAKEHGGPLLPWQVQKVMESYAPADPAMVLERAYATNTVSSLNTAGAYMADANLMRSAAVEIPKQVQDTLDDGSELLTKNQYILHRMQNTQQMVSEQTWPGYLADQAKSLVQPYLEYKQRGLIGSKIAGIGLGSNLDEAHYTLYRMPLPQFKETFDKAMDYLEKDNPSLAVSYAQSLLAQNTFDSALNNTFTAMAIPDLVGGAKLVKKVLTYNQARKATRDMVSAVARDPTASPATAAEGAGDLSEAAVARVSDNVAKAIEGTANPLEDAKSAFMSSWIDDASKFASNPGTYLGRELVTRLQDGFARKGEELLNRIMSMNRVERTPVAVTSEDVIRAYKDKIRTEYKGPPNTLADVEGPIREPISGTYWYRSKIINYDATQFSDKATAEGFAHQLGIDNPIIRGEEAGKLYIPETAAKNLESVKTVDGATRFYVNHDIEVMSSPTAQPGFVPYNTKTGKFEKALTEESARIEQQGLGFHIEVWNPMRENDHIIRDLMIKTTRGERIPDTISTNSATGINQIKNSLLGWVRTSDDTLSTNENAQRKAVTYTQSNIHQWAKELAKDLEDVAAGRVREDPVTGEPISGLISYPKAFFGKLSSRKVAQQFERTLDHARRMEDPATGEPGYFYKTAGELQDHYNRNFNRDPSYLETKAYFNYTKLIEGDRMLGEIAEFRNRARLGSEQHTIVSRNADGSEVRSPTFDGIRHNTFPGGSDYILVMGNTKGEEQLYQLGHINTKSLEAMRGRVERGEAKVVEIYNRDHMPLSGFSDVANGKLVSYVFTDKLDTKPLAFNHINRRGGGHFEWDYDHYIKQADVRSQHTGGNIADKRPGVEHLYVGDTTVMPIKSRKLGSDIVKIWNQAHELIKENRWDEVRPLAAKLGIEYREFASWYNAGRDANGNPVRARLSAHEPMVVVNKNKKIADMGSELKDRYLNTFRDVTRSGPANNFKVAYNTERRTSADFRTINDVGTKGNPIYAHQPAELIDPLTTMNRALNRAIGSTFMDDYKIFAVEHWLQEAQPFLKPTQAELRSSPFWHFHNPEWLPGIDKTRINNLMSNRYKIQSFVGLPNKFDTFVHALTSHLADGFYAKFGPEGSRNIFQKAVSIAPIWALHHLTDPVNFMRSVTFNFKLGLFAIPQFIVQAQTHALIWALEPKHGTAGTFAMMLHGWSRFNKNPAILRSLDNYATKLSGFGSRFRPGEFLEGMRELEKSGFEHVAGEYANINNQLKTRFIGNDMDKFLKLGQYPFRLGEQSTRVTAWYTAFREFREAHPTTPITNIERSQILNKADLLTVNMSRASSSVMNHGVFSLSTQFLTYQIKLAELFWGKRIGATATERNLARARMLVAFSALYGVPNAIGVTGAPISDNLREHFMDDLGYIPGEKWLSTMLNEGLPSWGLAMITGGLDLQKGNVENVGDRFGSQGWQNVKQGLRSDIPWWQAIGGAATTTFSNLFTSGLDPFYQGALSWARGDTGDARFTIRSADLVEPFKEISSVSSAIKVWTAMQTGKWISKNEGYATDVSPLRSAFLGLTGMNPQDIDNTFITNQMLKGETEAQKVALKDFIKDWRRGLDTMKVDPEQGNAYIRNAMARLTTVGYPYEKILSAMAIANKGWESSVNSSDFKSWQTGDRNKQDQRLDRYKRQQELNSKRNQ